MLEFLAHGTLPGIAALESGGLVQLLYRLKAHA